MNSSSAYSNVLNTSPVAPTVNNAPKRDLSDENSSNEFQQTLQNVRAEQDRNAQAESVKAVKNTSQRKAQVKRDDQQPPLDNDQSTKPADTKTLDGKKADAPKKIDSPKKADSDDTAEKNVTDEQNVANQVSTNTPVNDKATCAASLIDADIGQLTTVTDGATENSTIDKKLTTDEKLATDVKTISLDASGLAIKSAGKVGVDGNATGDAPTDKVSASLLAESVASAGLIQNGDIKVSDKNVTSDEKAEGGDDALLPGATSSNPLTTPAIIPSANVLAVNTSATADAQAADSTKAISGAKSLSNDAATTTTATTLVADEPASTFTGDAKNGFEKMLQAMVAANTGQQSQDSSSQSSSNTQSSSTAATPSSVFESLARTIDSQTPAARSFVVQTSVPVPVGQPQWSQAVGDKVLWLAAQNVSSAEIRLDPPDLGPMQVKVSVNQDQTNVSFTSHHPVVREVLDQNLHRLRDMFTEQGLNLGSVDVSDKSFSRQQGEGKGQPGSGNAAEAAVEDETPVAVSSIMQQRLVDHYA